MHDLIIIGGGPAGLAATSYALRKRLDALLVTRDFGGKTNLSVRIPESEPHRVIRARELVQGFRDGVEYIRDAYELARATQVTSTTDGYVVTIEPTGGSGPRQIEARAVLIATGTRHEPLGVPGETRFQGKALGYSSISYSHLLVDRRVFLVGNSRRTVNAALELAAQARRVILYLETTGRYHDVYRERLQAVSNIQMVEARRVVEFRGTDVAREVLLELPDGSVESYSADAFFIQHEPAPNSELVAGIVDLDTDQRIIVDTRNRTSEPGIFAAGDVTSIGFEQTLVALGEGAKAALSAYEQLTFPQ